MMGTTITSVFAVGTAIGTVLGLFLFNVLVLIPTMLVAATGVILVSVVTGLDYLNIVVGLVAIIVALQIGYLIGSLIGSIAADFVRMRTYSRSLSTMQTAIGQELKNTFELPQDLPPEMATLLARLDEQYAAS